MPDDETRQFIVSASDDPTSRKALEAASKKIRESPAADLLESGSDALLVRSQEKHLKMLLREFSSHIRLEPNNVVKPLATGVQFTSSTVDTMNEGNGASGDEIVSQPAQFIISAKRAARHAGLQMLADGGKSLVEQLRTYSGVDIEVIETYSAQHSQLASWTGATDTLLVRMDEQKGGALHQQSLQPSSPVWIEPNHRCEHYRDALSLPIAPMPPIAGLFANGAGSRLQLRVVGDSERPLSRAAVTIHAGVPMTALTDDDGVASFDLLGAGAIQVGAIVIDPRSMHWSKVVLNPQLQSGALNVIRLKSFFEFDSRFGASPYLSWGIERLNVRSRNDSTGGGVKIGIVDSGCDSTHDLLRHVRLGENFNPGAAAANWSDDDIGHGTHCAGVIGARPGDGMPKVSGLAPDAEIYSYKVFPDGSFYTLGKAVDAAIRDGVDILNLSLGSSHISPSLSDKIERARQAGIACIVAAGNSGTDVMFPANLNAVVAVSALGYSSVIPPDSISAQSFSRAFASNEGYFSPSFTCFGPSIDFAAPGVGVISTVPQNGLKVMDGTSMAAPHVTGLCALYLSSDRGLRSLPRSSGRVDALVERLRRGSYGLPFGMTRVGAGLPLFRFDDDTSSSVGAPRVAGISTAYGTLRLRLG